MTVILSILFDTFFSRISLSMPPIPKSHNTACVLSLGKVRHWQSRSFGYSSNWESISKWVPLIPLQSSDLCHSGRREALSSFRLHTLTACIIMAMSFGTVHAWMDVVLPDGLSVDPTGIPYSTVTVDHCAFQYGISSQKSQIHIVSHWTSESLWYL